MKKLLGIVLFLGFMCGNGQASSNAASIFANYTPTKSIYDPRCKNTSQCSKFIEGTGKDKTGYLAYRESGCLHMKATSSCSKALCKGECASKGAVNDRVIAGYSNEQQFFLKEACQEVCKTVELNELEIKALKQSGVFAQNYTFEQHTQDVVNAERRQRATQIQAKGQKQISNQLGKEVGGYGVTGLSKLKAKRDWEYKWLEYYKKEYNKEIQTLNAYYKKNIFRLQENFDKLNTKMAQEVSKIEEKFAGTSLERTKLSTKLEPYKKELAATPLTCPAQPDTCRGCAA